MNPSTNRLSPGFEKIELSGKNGVGKFALVSACDYDELSKFKWFLNRGYVVNIKHIKKDNGSRTTKTVYMHRVIMNAPDDMEVDHKNHNKLDNRRENLRICTRSENQLNNRAKGYCWDNTQKRWRVTVKINGKYTYRTYINEDDAKRAAKLVKSGVVPDKKTGRRNKYMPKYICKNHPNGYRFRFIKDKVNYSKYGFKTISEAVMYRDNFLKNFNIPRKEDI